MSTFWFNLLYLILVWGFALYTKFQELGFKSATVFLGAIFFIIYFILPFIHNRKIIFHISIFLLSAIVFLNFWSLSFNGFIFLILLIIAKDALDYLQGIGLYFHLIIQYVIVISPYLIRQDFILLTFTNLLILVTVFWLYFWQRTNKTHVSLKDRHDQLQNDYRKLKRQLTINEKNVRQEERNQIAREIHDSVGHRLTALLMQLEVIRLQSKDEAELEKINHLKSLAQISLSDTREAVKALKSEETTGLTAVIQLIRKLEAESHLQVAFNIKAGALSFPLTNKQSVALYRAVQEALTNMMRHSRSREAEIEFSIIGGNFFRFKISNPQKEKVELVEGFGLTAMRERLEQIDGTLNIIQVEGKFTLIGTFPMEKGD